MTQQQLKAKQLRYKKPMLKELNIETIKDNLYDMIEVCTDIQYYYDDNETLLNALDGDEDEAQEFKMMFSDLAYEVESMLDDLREAWIPDYFNDFCVSICGQNDTVLGYDAYEQDYMGLEWEDYAIEESGKRIARFTKNEIINMSAYVFRILFSYVALQSRYNDLKAAYDILSEKNLNILKTVDKINEIYENAMDSIHQKDMVTWEKLTGQLPQETWLY